ncbi:YibE/F, partial [Thermus scotoductus]
MRPWILLGLLLFPALAQGDGRYLVGRILALEAQRDVALVEVEGGRLEALLPVDGGGYR